MTDDDRFERDLAAVVRAGAPELAPPALRERVAASVRSNPRQPARRAPMFAVLAAAIVLIAVGLVGAPWLRGPSPGATQLGTVAAGYGSAPPTTAGVASPTARPIAEPILDPGQVQVGRLLTPSDGWVQNTDNHVYLTQSSGATWREITPTGTTANTRLQPYFLDPAHGWIGVWDDTATAGLVLWRTTDGALNWSRSVLPDVNAVNWDLGFLTPTVGWLASDPGGGAPKPELRWTSDGGATWSDPIDLAGATGLATLGHLAFADREHGVISDGAGVRATRDGGRTWSTVTLPDLPKVASGSAYLLDDGPATFVDASHGFLVVDVTALDYSVQARLMYATATAGADWRLVLRDDLRRDWAFVDPLDWIGLGDGQVWTTHDGGVTFSVQGTSGLPSPYQGAQTVFVDQRNGWGAIEEGAPCSVDGFGCPVRGPALFATSDGGQIWRRIGDCIFACESPKPS